MISLLPKPRGRSMRLLDEAPFLIEELPTWFRTLSDADFDQVCVPVTVSAVLEEQLDGRISAKHLCLLLNAIRQRFRNRLSGQCKPHLVKVRNMGASNGNATLNEVQVRIIRQIGPSMANQAIADIFGTGRTTIRLIRLGESWKHVTSDKPLYNIIEVNELKRA